ncbi:MAG: hypothetical protein JSR18_05255, partial [Proteobacteria bacterium]|nr:hypothetical protein [Pseudomonadota bacterium]
MDVLLQLREAADHGDARAACRIGIELRRCYMADYVSKVVDEEEKSVTEIKDPAKAAYLRADMADTRAMIAPDVAMCQGVAQADIDEAWSYLVQSASAGDGTAAGTFYTAPPTRAFAENSEILDVWLQHREEYRDMAIRSGDIYALQVASMQAISGMGWGGRSRTFPKDMALAVEYATALRPLLSDNMVRGPDYILQEARKTLTPAEI